MLNRQQFEPHAFMDPQPEGLYVGGQLFRSARVYSANLDAPENQDDPPSPPVNRSAWLAHVPQENGGHVALRWNESKDRIEGDVHVAALGGLRTPAFLSRWSTGAHSADETLGLLSKASTERVHDRRTPEEAEGPASTAAYERYR